MKLLVLDPTQRIAATDALRHNWITRSAPWRPPVDGKKVLRNLRAFAALSRFKRYALSVPQR